MDRQKLGILLLAGRKFLRRAQLHQDAGEGLGKSVVDFLANTRAFLENGRFLGRVRKTCQLNCQRRLLRKCDEQLAVLHLGRCPFEAQHEEADSARREYQRVDHNRCITFAPVKCENARPDVMTALLDVDVERFELATEHMRKR